MNVREKTRWAFREIQLLTDKKDVFMSLYRPLEKSEEVSKIGVFEIARALDSGLPRAARSHEGFTGAHARAAGHYICVRYHLSQEPFYLNIDEARRYLEWIRAGHVGPHWDLQD
jgi:hypothetical protein